MAVTTVTLNGVSYFVPQPGERGPTYDQDLTNYLIALATAFPQGGTAPSAGFSVLQSNTVNPATAGSIRLAKTDLIDWRNQGNTANGSLGINANDDAQWVNGTTGVTTILSGQSFVYATGSTTSFANAANTVATWTTSVTDTDAAFNTGTGTFTVPVGKGGRYLCIANIHLTGLTGNTGSQSTNWLVNGASRCLYAVSNALNGVDQTYPGNAILNLSAGDLVRFSIGNNNGGARSPTVSATENYIMIHRLPS